MKRCTAVCLLVILFLFGCSAPKDSQVSCKDLTLTLPEAYLDLSGEPYAEDTDFLYGRDQLIVLGLGEKKSDLDIYTLDAYTAQVLNGNALACALETVGNSYRFTYEAPVGDTRYSYVTGTYESPEYFWVVQCYCPTQYLETYRQEISAILDSVKIKP